MTGIFFLQRKDNSNFVENSKDIKQTEKLFKKQRKMGIPFYNYIIKKLKQNVTGTDKVTIFILHICVNLLIRLFHTQVNQQY